MRSRLTALLQPSDPPTPVWGLLGLAAVAVGIAGYLHGRLFHQGYAHVEVVGPLFLLNVISSGAVIVLLLMRRPWLFALSALGISAGAVVSILISHSTSFFGFAEHRYDSRATTIVVAECAALVLVLLAGAVAAVMSRRATPAEDRPRRPAQPAAATAAAPAWRPGAVSSALGAVVLAGTVLVAVGVGQGAPPSQVPVSAAAVARSRAAVAAAGPEAARGRSLFDSSGCDACHTIGAADAGGRLGPRLDSQYLARPAGSIEADIVAPPRDIPGFEPGLMPENYAQRLGRRDLQAIAAFIHTAATGATGRGSTGG